MAGDTHKLRLRDGRDLAYCEFGAADGHPVFYAHGSPGSRLEGAMYDEKAAEYGFRLIATDRPGFGRSTLKPGRRLLDYPDDIVELADYLELERFGVIGHSGGGAHTTVCGYAIPDRLSFNMSIAGYSNFGEFPEAVALLNTKADRMSVGLSSKHPRLFASLFGLMALSVKYAPNAYYKAVSKAGNETDREICSDPAFKALLIADQREAMVQGGEGVAIDAAIHYLDWGFRLQDIAGKVIVLHGSDDRIVSPRFAQHLAENIPNCDFNMLDGLGHLFPWDNQDLIFQTAAAEL